MGAGVRRRWGARSTGGRAGVGARGALAVARARGRVSGLADVGGSDARGARGRAGARGARGDARQAQQGLAVGRAGVGGSDARGALGRAGTPGRRSRDARGGQLGGLGAAWACSWARLGVWCT